MVAQGNLGQAEKVTKGRHLSTSVDVLSPEPVEAPSAFVDYATVVRWLVSDFCYRFRQHRDRVLAGPHFVNRWAKPNATRMADSRAGGKP